MQKVRYLLKTGRQTAKSKGFIYSTGKSCVPRLASHSANKKKHHPKNYERITASHPVNKKNRHPKSYERIIASHPANKKNCHPKNYERIIASDPANKKVHQPKKEVG